MSDFGADESFNKATSKIKEHYGIVIAPSSERKITLKHAEIIKSAHKKKIATKNKRSSKKELNQRAGNAFIVSETDATMVPIVAPNHHTKDSRKNKEVMYKEARLTLAYNTDENIPVFSATFADVETVGKHIRYCVDESGCGGNSIIHAVGDGATWIADQIDKQFGAQASYLIDFYHASEYLANASHEFSPTNPKQWLPTQQQLLKYGKYKQVLHNLNKYIDQESTASYKCYHYLKRRTHHKIELKYQVLGGL